MVALEFLFAQVRGNWFNDVFYSSLRHNAHKGPVHAVRVMLHSAHSHESNYDSLCVACLRHASEAGHVDLAKMVIERCREANSMKPACLERLYGRMIVCASANGQLDIVKLLIQTFDGRDFFHTKGRLLLHYAAMGGHLDIVKFALDSQLLDLHTRDRSLCTVLHRAAQYGHAYVVKTLLDADPAFINTRDAGGCVALHRASQCGHSQVAQLLLNSKPSHINARDNKQRTPLFYAAGEGHADVIDTLLLHPSVDVSACDEDGCSALHYSAGCASFPATKRLLNDIRTLNVRDRSGREALHYAVRCQRSDIIELLAADFRFEEIQCGSVLDESRMFVHRAIYMYRRREKFRWLPRGNGSLLFLHQNRPLRSAKGMCDSFRPKTSGFVTERIGFLV